MPAPFELNLSTIETELTGVHDSVRALCIEHSIRIDRARSLIQALEAAGLIDSTQNYGRDLFDILFSWIESQVRPGGRIPNGVTQNG